MNRQGWKLWRSSIRGKRLLARILRNINFKDLLNTAIILFPEDDNVLNEYGVKYVDEFLIRSASEQAILLYCCDYVCELINLHTAGNITEYKMNKQEMADIITFYSLFSFSKRIRIISLELPFCRNGKNLLAYDGIDKELLVGIGIYHIIPFTRLRDIST